MWETHNDRIEKVMIRDTNVTTDDIFPLILSFYK
jgi:hypothetical protein